MKNPQYFQAFIDYLKQHGLAQPVGCSVAEMTQLENTIGYSLPQAYKEYLSLLGKDYEGVMVGTHCFIDNVESNNAYLPELLAENKLTDFVLPESYSEANYFLVQGLPPKTLQL